MITLRRSSQRRHVQHGKCEVWLTFYHQEPPALIPDDFGILAAFDETRLPPGGGCAPRVQEDAEVVTYVFAGALAQQGSTGGSGVVHAGEYQRMILGRAVRHKETNASRNDWAHVFRISLRPAEVGPDGAHEQKRFAAAQRRNVLCVVASPDGRRGSLRTSQDAVVYSSVLDPGHHLIHELLPGRSAWLHVVHGEVTLPDVILTHGDGVGVTIEPVVSLTAQESAEILLVDLGPTRASFASRVVP